MGRAPCVDNASRLTSIIKLRPGCLAAPEVHYLPLLPSGPDGIHSSSPRKTRPSTPPDKNSPEKRNLDSEFNPAIADLGYRAPLVPRLARPGYILLCNPKRFKVTTHIPAVQQGNQASSFASSFAGLLQYRSPRGNDEQHLSHYRTVHSLLADHDPAVVLHCPD
jgi:hypothetical protein